VGRGKFLFINNPFNGNKGADIKLQLFFFRKKFFLIIDNIAG
jgi:hypothetical protein